MAEVKWYGAKVLEKAKRDALELVEKKAEQVEKTAKELVPVVTGALKESITSEIDKDDLEARVGSNLDYALAVELGAPGKVAKPFLRPALEKARDK